MRPSLVFASDAAEALSEAVALVRFHTCMVDERKPAEFVERVERAASGENAAWRSRPVSEHESGVGIF